jgi:uncharacterized protein (DUF433 family)
MARQALAEAERSGDLEVRIAARWACAVFGFFAEGFTESARHCAAALDLCGDDLEIGRAALGYSPWLIIRGVCGAALVMSGRLIDGATISARGALNEEGQRWIVYWIRISIDPNICHGQPCVKGTRIIVWLVVQYLVNGDSVEDILAAYPSLMREDVQACLPHAAEMTRERVLPTPVAS